MNTYEDDSKTLELEQNVIYRIDNHDVDINDVSCPYKKRRHITLLRTVKNEELNYSLCRAISNYHGISNLDSYSKQILNALYNYYMFGNDMSFVLMFESKHLSVHAQSITFYTELPNY